MPWDSLLHTVAQAQPNTADIINDLARTPLSQVVKFIGILTVVRLAVYPILKNTPAHQRGGLYGLARVVNEILDAFVYAGAFVFLIIRPFALQTFRIPSGSMWPTLYVNDFIVANKAIYRYSDPKPGDIVVFRPPNEATSEDQEDENGEVKVDFIKRCIGTPGDVVELREGVLYRNGKLVDEPNKHYSECTKRMGNGDCEEFKELDTDTKDHMTMPNFKIVKYKDKYIPLNWTRLDANRYPFAAAGIMDRGNSPYSIAKEYALEPAEADLLIKQEPQKIPAGYYLMMGDNRNGSFDGRAWGLVPRDSIIGRSEFIWLPISRWQATR